MSRYPGMAKLIEAGGRRSTRADIAARITAKSTHFQNTQEALGDNGIVSDPGTVPAPPTGIFVRPRNRGMDISWAPPPATDHVSVTEAMLVRTRDGAVSIHKLEAKLLGGSINGLEPTEYDVSLQHRNKFGKASGFATPSVKITPSPTIAEQIAADVQVAAAQITGELGQAQIPTITDPSKLSEEAVKLVASVANKNLLSLPESKFDAYLLGDWAVVGPKKHAYGAGTAGLSTVSSGGRTWLRHSTNASAAGATDTVVGNGWAHIFDVTQYNTAPNKTYILSCTVRNTSAGAISTRLCTNIYDANNAVLTNAIGATATPVGGGGTARAFVKFTMPASGAKLRPFTELFVASVFLDYNDFQLEEVASTATGPTPYATPAFFTGAIGANLISAWDLTAVRAIIGNLTVESSKILSLAAEKFVGGTITGQEFVLATGGRFRTANNGTRIDDGGIDLKAGDSFDAPSLARDHMISDAATGKASVSFYANADIATNGNYRGIVLRSDGITGERVGAIVLHATVAGGSPTAASAASVELISVPGGAGEVSLGLDALMRRDIRVLRNAKVDGALDTVLFNPSRSETITVAAGTTGIITWGTPLPRRPRFHLVQIGTGEPLSTSDGLCRVTVMSATEIRIQNQRTTGITVTVFVQA